MSCAFRARLFKAEKDRRLVNCEGKEVKENGE